MTRENKSKKFITIHHLFFCRYPEKLPKYTVEPKRKIYNIWFTKLGEDETIRFRFMQIGKKNTSIFDLHINPFGSAMLSNVEDEIWL
ncbi:MAG: hypothetical protein IIB82_12875 [Bacteroidetes bacterium]|nr:hypothetical protein [Bacteroidota bacterium]